MRHQVHQRVQDWKREFIYFLADICTSYLFKVSVNANVVQSLTITMARIREVTTEMARLSREIGVRVISNV